MTFEVAKVTSASLGDNNFCGYCRDAICPDNRPQEALGHRINGVFSHAAHLGCALKWFESQGHEQPHDCSHCKAPMVNVEGFIPPPPLAGRPLQVDPLREAVRSGDLSKVYSKAETAPLIAGFFAAPFSKLKRAIQGRDEPYGVDRTGRGKPETYLTLYLGKSGVTTEDIELGTVNAAKNGDRKFISELTDNTNVSEVCLQKAYVNAVKRNDFDMAKMLLEHRSWRSYQWGAYDALIDKEHMWRVQDLAFNIAVKLGDNHSALFLAADEDQILIVNQMPRQVELTPAEAVMSEDERKVAIRSAVDSQWLGMLISLVRNEADRGLAVKYALEQNKADLAVSLLQQFRIQRIQQRVPDRALFTVNDRAEIMALAIKRDSLEILSLVTREPSHRWEAFVEAARQGKLDIVRDLLIQDDIPKRYRREAIEHAIRNNSLEILTLLIKEPSVRGEAVIMAVKLNNLVVVRHLLAQGDIPNLFWCDAMYEAVSLNSREILSLFTQQPFDRGDAVKMAVQLNNLDLVRHLLSQGDIEHIEQALAIAIEENCDPAIIAMLRKHTSWKVWAKSHISKVDQSIRTLGLHRLALHSTARVAAAAREATAAIAVGLACVIGVAQSYV